mgnify:CR=1 FL=1
MKYFDTLPKIITSDNNNNNIILTNLLARASVINSLLTNPLLFYSYDIQEGDTPEIIAHKYYDDMYRYWIVLMVNQIMDPQWDWPLNSQQLQAYIVDKYGSVSTAQSQIDHYEQKITITNSQGSNTNIQIIVVDQSTYQNNITGSFYTATLPSGVTVTTKNEYYPVYSYDNEITMNEAKRTINLIDKRYTNTIENQFKQLMSL